MNTCIYSICTYCIQIFFFFKSNFVDTGKNSNTVISLNPKDKQREPEEWKMASFQLFFCFFLPLFSETANTATKLLQLLEM